MDKIDRCILNVLQENGRITNVELARTIGLSPASSLDRVKKLERRGVIKGYVALVDPEKVSRGTSAFVAVTLASHESSQVRAFRDRVQALPEVLECYHVAGENDYLLKVVVDDIQAYEHLLLEDLTAIPNVGKIHTSFVLSTVKHDTRVPVDSTE